MYILFRIGNNGPGHRGDQLIQTYLDLLKDFGLDLYIFIYVQ